MSGLAQIRVCALFALLSLGAAAQQSPPAALDASFTANAQEQSRDTKIPRGAADLPNAPSAADTSPATSAEGTALPVATAPFAPLARHQKFERWGHSTYSPYTFASVLFSTTYSQMVGDWPTYGGGMEGFGKRFGATLADTEVRGFFVRFLGPTLLHEDPRYFYSGKKGFVPRGWYAATRVLVTRNDEGQNTFNTSEVAGTLFTKSLSNAYYPERDRGFPETMSRTFGALLSDAGSNVLREFWPDIRRTFQRHEPKRLKRMEERMPRTMVRIGKAASPVAGEE